MTKEKREAHVVEQSWICAKILMILKLLAEKCVKDTSSVYLSGIFARNMPMKMAKGN